MSFIRRLIVALTATILSSAALAEGTATPQQTEMTTAISEANAALQGGPQKVAVMGQASLDLPEGYGFVPAAQSIKLLRAMGNKPGDDISGIIVPMAEAEPWFIVVRYIASGYIKDDDARDWKADDLLANIRKGTEDSNKERAQRGLPEIEVTGWVEAPHYEADTHRLVWSLANRAKAGAANEQGVNYNTLALGREGYVSMNLVTDLQQVDARKPIAKMLLGALNFDAGKRYADFNDKTDKVAEYGLAALVAGVAVKKLGLFAVIAAFAAKFAKVIGVAALAGGAGLAKFFGRKKDNS